MKNRILTGLMVCLVGLAASAQSLLWKIEGNGLKEPSYIFGTIHIQDKRVFNFNDSLPAKMAEVDQLALELDLSPTAIFKFMQALSQSGLKGMKEELSKKAYEALAALVKKELDKDLSEYDSMSPFVVINELSRKYLARDMNQPVDIFLRQKAVGMGKPAIGIESYDEQMEVFSGLSNEEIIQFCEDFGNYQKTLDEMIGYYLAGDLVKMNELAENEGGFSEDRMDALLDKRNVVMADRIDTMIQKHSTLVAIGAGHLKGNDGVIDLLMAKGYSVKPILANKSTWPEEEAAVNGWQRLEVQETYSILIPGKTEYQVLDIPVDEQNVAKYHMYMHQVTDLTLTDNVVYQAAIINYPAALNLPLQDKANLYDESMKGSMSSVGGTLVDQKDVEMLGVPGREFSLSFQEDQAIMHMRLVLIGNDMILLQAISMMEKKDNPDTKRFFESIQLIEKK